MGGNIMMGMMILVIVLLNYLIFIYYKMQL